MRKILVVIDMQNDFIDGSLGTKEAQQIVPRVVEKMKEYDPWNIYLTRDTHYENYLDTQEGRNLPVEHCIEGTHGWQLNDAVAKAAEKATVIDKPTFGSNRLAGILMTERAQEALEIELVGLCTDICVVSNALLFKAAMPEAPITVDASCCAGVTPESHRHALETMKMCQIKVVNDLRKKGSVPLAGRFPFSALHVPAEEGGDGLRELVLRLADVVLTLVLHKQHQPQRVALGNDGRGDGGTAAVERVGDVDAALAALRAVDGAVLHDLLQLGADALADQIAPRAARRGHHTVAVRHGDGQAGGFVECFTDLCGKLVHTAHERVFLEDDLALLARVDLQRVAAVDNIDSKDLARSARCRLNNFCGKN